MAIPVTNSADTAHKILHRAVLMSSNEFAYRVVEVKRSHDGNRRGNHRDDPVKNRAAVHKISSRQMFQLLLSLILLLLIDASRA